jgi:hypothetical protein
MTVNEILTAITTVGFPIVACAALFWYHVKVASKMTDAINNNTLAITKVLEKIEDMY